MLNNPINTNILKTNNQSDTFVIENLKIYISFAYSIIYLKIFNTMTFTCYEISIYESTIIDNKFNINELYTFMLKSFKKEDNHTFICKITSENMIIELNALLNQYFKLNYEIKLDKKENIATNQNENINNIITKDNSSSLKEELKKNNDIINLKINELSDIINLSEICIGHANYEIATFNNLFIPLCSEILNINILVLHYQITPKQITLYFSKIKKLSKLKKIYSYKQIPICLYDDSTNTVISNKLLDDYCSSKNIEIFLI